MSGIDAEPERPRAACVTAAIALIVTFVLTGAGLLVFQVTKQPHNPYGWALLVGATISFLTTIASFAAYADDGQGSSEDDIGFYWGGQ